jgi:monoamine oxidase
LAEKSGRELVVGIVGAGPAGISAALELRKQNYDVTLLERTSRVGGKSCTIYCFNEELNRTVPVEAGQAFIFPSPVMDNCFREAGLDESDTVDYPPVQFKKTDLSDPISLLIGRKPVPSLTVEQGTRASKPTNDH